MRTLNALLITLMTALSLYISYDTWKHDSYSPPQEIRKKQAPDFSQREYRGAGLTPDYEPMVASECGSGFECYVPSGQRLGTRTLVLLAWPSPGSPIRVYLPKTGVVLRATGRTALWYNGTLWREVTYRNCIGWVNDYYIRKY